MERTTTTILLVGVGGQGTILAAELLAQAALASGQDVKVSEIHGMAQRGGSVVTVVRAGEAVDSMVCDEGCADYIVAFETTEGLRALPYLAEGGTLVVNDEAIAPMSVLAGGATMPEDAVGQLLAADAVVVPAAAIAREVGNLKTVNVVLLGALSALMPYEVETWNAVLAASVPPKTIEANIAAFAGGRSFMDEHRD